MRKSRMLSVLIIVSAVVALLDIAYLAFAFAELGIVATGTGIVPFAFLWITVAAVVLNAALLAFAVAYIAVRNKKKKE